jgi:hypothetical protein
MADTALMSSNIVATLDLGDHLYDDVRSIVEGKLRDRVDKLLGKKVKDGSIITEERISNTISYAMGNLLEAPVALVLETANYYRKKYSLAI